MSLARVWLAVALVLPALVALLVPLPAVDLAYQLRVGDMILATGAVPHVDTFTFTVNGQPWTDQQWLAQAVLALVYRLGGWDLLSVLRAGLLALTSGLLIRAAIDRGASVRAASMLSLVAFAVSAPALALRPQLFAVAVFAALLVLVAGRDRHPRLYLAAPLLVVGWANLHGSFVLAPLLLGYAWLDDVLRHRPARRSFAVLAAGSIATAVTPFGAGVWGYALGIGTNSVISGQVSEWQRTSPLTPTGALFYAAAAAVGCAAWRGRARIGVADWLWLAGLTLLGAWAVRGVAWWAPGAVPVAAAAVSRPPAEPAVRVARARPPRAANRALAALLTLVTVLALPWWRPADALAGRRGLLAYAPSGIAEALRVQAPAGARVFVPQTWASWFEWAVPNGEYLVDSRFELYPAQVWADYDAIVAGGPPAAAALDRRGVQFVVVPSGWQPPTGAWKTTYSDGAGSILVRAPAP